MTTESKLQRATARSDGHRLRASVMWLVFVALGAVSFEPTPAGAHVLTGPGVLAGPGELTGPGVLRGPGALTDSPVLARRGPTLGHRAAGRLSLASGFSSGPAATSGGPQLGSYSWPVRGPVIRPFEPPANPYSAGHRGIDIAAAYGTRIRAPADGTVAFAGMIAGSLFISIDHPDGVRTSYSWISAIGVKKGQAVRRGDVIGQTGFGDPGSAQPCLHFGARLNGVYIDPMLLLGGGNLDDVIHLAPVG
ncbi:MAG: murein hydrolase activator EnvC family protein [Actinomycetota bacterium]